jgi:60 kDa SS-A/Ro ribonucleoprotein
LDDALEMLTDKTLIKKSLVLPFRYTTAYQEIANAGLSGRLSRQVLGALNKAVDIAVSNVPELPGDTAVVLDISGSMGGQPIQIGSLFAAVLAKANNADVYTFASRAHSIPYNQEDSTITIADKLVEFFHSHSGGTDFNVIFPYLKEKYDRVIILSDMQGWMSYYAPTGTLRAYEKKYDVKPYVYSFDLAGHGTLQFPEARVCALAGFSEKIFDVMKLVEQDKKALIHEIDKVIL